MDKWEQVLVEIDKYNQKRPNVEIFEGQNLASEIIYAIRVTRWVKQFFSNPSNELLVAARGAHIGRWEVPRDSYPTGLKGYYEWKSFLLKYHAQKVTTILVSNEIAPDTINKITDIIMRKSLKENIETQTLEDAVSLVFLEIQLLPLMAKATEEKVINAIQKTWLKMSLLGQNKALELNLPEEAKVLIKKALNLNQ